MTTNNNNNENIKQKIKVGWMQNIQKSLAPEKILVRNIKFAIEAGLTSVKWLLNAEDLEYLNRNRYKYEPTDDRNYPNDTYIVYFDIALFSSEK